MARGAFRVAVRKFDPFESAIRKQWELFEQSEQTGLELEAVALDLHPLREALFEQRGLREGDWDVAFAPTDWIAEAAGGGDLENLAPRIAIEAPDGYPDACPSRCCASRQWTRKCWECRTTTAPSA